MTLNKQIDQKPYMGDIINILCIGAVVGRGPAIIPVVFEAVGIHWNILISLGQKIELITSHLPDGFTATFGSMEDKYQRSPLSVVSR